MDLNWNSDIKNIENGVSQGRILGSLYNTD